ncbi:helix-turn-helix domain-containing protein [Bacillus freudenreichii]|nr:helix-turn-helix domain-containing protein [Bacillus freudenreichii]
MTLTKTKYCDNCQENVDASIIERPATYTFKGETFELTERVLVCECGHDLYDELIDSETMNTLKKMYEDRVGLSLDDIKNVRAQYGLSMDLFSRILGWSKATIARYETGKFIPDSSHMSVLKRLKEKPEEIDEYYKSNQHKFTQKERDKITEKLMSNDEIKVERGLTEALGINYKIHERTIDSGFSEFSLEKITNMVIFFAKNGVLKTKLMKLLFYSDFLHYKRNLLSMSGMPYVKLPFGPVPKDHELLLSTIEKSDFVNTEYEFNNEYTLINIVSKKEFDDSLFSPEEIEILNQVNEYFNDFGSVAISDFSHKETAWIETEDNEIISYDYAGNLLI